MSGRDPAFTVVVPAYNAEATLPAALGSLDAQLDRDFEVVVVDDGSTDATPALADELCAARGWRVVHQPNAGLPAARNAAIAVARGRWIALLDADDWLLPPYLGRMRALLASAPRVGLAFGDAWEWYEGSGRFGRGTAMAPYRPRVIPEAGEPCFRALLRTNFVYGAATFPRALAERLGGFDETLRAAEDWNLWLRIVAAGWRIAQTRDPLAVYRRRAGQMTADAARMHAGSLAALRGVQGACRLDPGPAAALEAAIASAERDLRGSAVASTPGRRLLRAAIRSTRPVRSYRLRAPRPAVEAFPELRRGGGR